jgi:uncharacterized protein involved in response to NO
MKTEPQTPPLRSEPFRIFFPLAFALGTAGVVHWILFASGVLEHYLARFHAVTQTQAFLVAFAAGFLLTAIPKRTGTKPASLVEIGALAVLLPAVSLATRLEFDVTGQLAYAAAILVLAQFAVRRFLSRTAGRRPPASFVLVAIALGVGLAGAACSAAGLGLDVPGWVLGLGRSLVFKGVFLCLALGVGAFFLPLAGRGEAAPDLDANRRAPIGYACAGLALVAGLVLEDVADHPRLGALVCGATAAFVLAVSGALRPPTRPGANRKLVWAAAWALPAGLLGAAAFPDKHIEALHVTFVGGFGLLAFAVATHVGLGHGGHEAEQQGRPWSVIAFGGLMIAAMVVRASALVVPAQYFGWLGAAAALWMAGAITWAAFLLPRLRRDARAN